MPEPEPDWDTIAEQRAEDYAEHYGSQQENEDVTGMHWDNPGHGDEELEATS